jgi:hypothetical protein
MDTDRHTAAMTPDTYTSPAPRRPGWLIPVLVVAAVLVLALGGVATWALLRTPAAATPVAAPAPAMLNVNGEISGYTGAGWKLNATCAYLPAYGDVTTGAQVRITDPSGKVVGLTQLTEGTIREGALEGTRGCGFPFNVQVPAGLGIYGIEVAHRGVVSFPEAALAGKVSLTIGS